VYALLIRSIIQEHIVNRRRYTSRLQSQKEREELLAKDPNAIVPAKKRGRPVAADSLRKRLKAIREEVERARGEIPNDEGRKESESEEERESEKERDSDEDDGFQ